MKTVRLGDIIEVNKNSITSKDNFDKIYYLDTGSITQNNIESYQEFHFSSDKIPSRAKRKVKDKTIIYSTVRPNQKHYGYMENPKENIIVSTGFCTLDVKDKEFDPKFIYYLLTQDYVTDYLHTIGTNSVSSYPAINPDDIANLKFKIPNLKTQQSIAKILSQLDQKIALNNQINAQLEQMAKTLYDYWFVQFDFPDDNGKPYKSSGGEMVYNEQLKREIPKGWGVKSLKEIANTGSGGTPKSDNVEYYKNGNIAWINSGELNESIIIDSKNFITRLGMENSSAKLFPKDTILLAMYGATAGKSALLTFQATTNQAICAIIPKDKRYLIYLKIYLDKLQEYLVNLSSGSARDNLSQDKIKELNILVPNDYIIDVFYKNIITTFEKIILNKKQNQQLTQLRDFLLPMLMNGQVGVSDE